MIDMNYLKRLGLHGGRLMWRVAQILSVAVFSGLLKYIRDSRQSETDYDENDTPQPHEFEHPDWGIYWGGR